MTALWPPAELPGLHVDLGVQARYPAADYRCALCGETESASGDGVRAFVATIHRTHKAACPARQKGTP